VAFGVRQRQLRSRDQYLPDVERVGLSDRRPRRHVHADADAYAGADEHADANAYGDEHGDADGYGDGDGYADGDAAPALLRYDNI